MYSTLASLRVKSQLFDNIDAVPRGMASSSGQTELKECADAYLKKLVMSLYPNLLSHKAFIFSQTKATDLENDGSIYKIQSRKFFNLTLRPSWPRLQ